MSGARVLGFSEPWLQQARSLAVTQDLYNDPREESGKMLRMFPAKGMFDIMKARHALWMEKYPNTPEARDWHRQNGCLRVLRVSESVPHIEITGLPKAGRRNGC
jgi:hypothetical protein